MKAVLEFNLPEEQEEFETSIKAGKYVSAIWSFDQYLRNKLKYEELPAAERETLEKVRIKFWNALEEYGVDGDF